MAYFREATLQEKETWSPEQYDIYLACHANDLVRIALERGDIKTATVLNQEVARLLLKSRIFVQGDEQ